MLCVEIKLKWGAGEEEMGVRAMDLCINRRKAENVPALQVEGGLGQRPGLGFAPGLLR